MAITAAQRSGKLASGENIWENLAKSGAIQGDYTYYSQGLAKPQEYQNLLSKALGSDQRRAVVDYLFDVGAAQGDRNYWYESRGDEDMNLALTLGGVAPTSISEAVGGAAPSSGTATAAPERDLDTLRAERLQSALDAIAAQFDYQSGSLRASRNEMEELFGQQTTANELLLKQTERGQANQAAERGIGRSGLYAQYLAEALQPIAAAQANNVRMYNPATGAEGTQIRDIMSQLVLLDQQRASAEAEARLAAEQDELDIEQLVAMINAGLT